jgi:hypothetical protein
VLSLEEQRSVRKGSLALDSNQFNLFIEDNGLVDLPLCGRRYKWFKGDGTSMSRIDRYLLSEESCLCWPNYFQVTLLRGLSDHCPLHLSIDEENWEPRPTRMLKCCQDVPGYHQFVQDKWNSFYIEGWGGFVIKEKLKLIKAALREWHTTHAKNIPGRIDILKNRLSELDEKGAEGGLSNEELNEMRDITHDIHYLLV